LPPIIMGIHREGVAYGCLDGSLTYVFYLLLASKETTHLRLLSRLAQFSRKPGITKNIIAAHSTDEVSRLLMEDDYESMAQSLS
ncbi:MAG: PTS sugar transporter subunit IIA, partial [Spirochaetota bacterium]